MGDASSLGGRLKRRLVTIPVVALTTLLFVALAPLTLLAVLVIDLVRRRRMVALRMWASVGTYLVCNVGGQLVLGLAWLASGFGLARARLIRWTHGIQAGWVAILFTMVTRIWGLRWQVEGRELLAPAPLVLLVRHASLLDTLIPNMYLSRAHGVGLRFVLKRELLVDPCLDIAGHILPNHFVDRDPEDSRVELEAITKLARDVAEDEALVIYPEGTRFSAAKRARIVARLEQRDPELAARAGALRHTLLPRPGGTLALLRNAPGLDVVICGHVGLDGFMTPREVWSGALVGRVIAVSFWRHPAAELPDDDEGRTRWLHARWAELDAWIAAREQA